jgi:small-conductance mechanosensitive channel
MRLEARTRGSGKVLGRLFAALMAVMLLLPVSGGTVQAQSESGIEIILPADIDPAQRDAFLEALQGLDQPITVNDRAPGATSRSEEAGFALVIGRFDDALAGIADLPATVSAWWRGLGGGSTLLSLWAVVALALAVGGGIGAAWGANHLLRRWRPDDEVRTARFAPRLGAAMAAFALEIVRLLAFAAGMLLVGWLLLPATAGARATLAILVIAAFRLQLLLAIGRLLFEPYRPALRLMPMPDDDAKKVWRGILAPVLTVVIAQALRDVLVAAGTTPAAGAFLGILAAAVVFGGQLYMIREASGPIRRLLLRVVGDREGAWAAATRLFAELWHLLFFAFAVIIFVTTLYQDLAFEAAAVTTARVGPLLLLILLPFVLTAYGALIDDLVMRDAEGTRRAVLGEVARTLGQGVILLATLAGVAHSLGFSPFRGAAGDLGDRLAGSLFEAAAAVLVGWALWHALKVFLEHEVPEEGEEPSEEGMGKPGSRIATLLPVLRSFLFVTIVIIAGITALAALGIQIAPLLAGAGVLGLAIGFGAQTLVQDVITGLFYLVEDAFRQGEYIETDAGKGVVEKISVRSVRLRHHRGPLYTIPFGQMGNIVNHSRDWVKVKFLLTVPFDTDLEQVRKLIKQVGQEMLQDPVLGPLFLQPVTSQGVMDVGSSGFTIGVKFLSRPGEQFLIRREAYARIKQAFVENGIEFATPRVTVDSETSGHETGAAAAALAAAEAAKAKEA